VSASPQNDFCSRCELHADWCGCSHCEHCARWTGLEDDDAPLFCRTCRPMFEGINVEPRGLRTEGVA
jgi:hypothetical protein